MTDTPNLGLPLLAAAQAQKHVTHNEALARLDALAQIAVASRSSAAPPASPADGVRYIVPTGGTGAFAGHDGELAWYDVDLWRFLTPQPGWIAYVADEAATLIHSGGGWVALAAALGALDNIAHIGVSTTADATNRLAVKSPAALFAAPTVAEGGAGDIRLVVEKETAADTASLLFQTGYSGRAEFGLSGDDDFHVKVSPDGSAWTEALRVDRTSGAVAFPAGASGLRAASLALGVPANLGLSTSAASGALTISLTTAAGAAPSVVDPVTLPFRNVSLASGQAGALDVGAALSLTLSAGSTLGMADGEVASLWLVALNAAGAPRLAAINCRAGTNVFPLAAAGLLSAVAEGGAGAADSAHVAYAGAATSAAPFCILGRLCWETPIATAGSWTAPSRIELHRPGAPLPGDQIQLRQVAVSSATTTSSTSYQTTGVSDAIALSCASNLVAGRVSGNSFVSGAGACIVEAHRGGMALGMPAAQQAAGATTHLATVSLDFRDLPGTASATTYMAKLRSSNGTASVSFPAGSGNGGGGASLQLAEIVC